MYINANSKEFEEYEDKIKKKVSLNNANIDSEINNNKLENHNEDENYGKFISI